MTYTKLILCSVLLTLALSSCRLKKAEEIDAGTVNREIKERKVRRFTDTQLTQLAFERAHQISELVADSLQQAGGAACGAVATDRVPERWKLVVVSIELLCNPTLPDEKATSAKEKAVWAAYRNALAAGQTPDENLQKLEDNNYLYTLPLTSAPSDATPSGVTFLRLLMSKKELILSTK